MPIKCGNGAHYHDTIDEVRTCFSQPAPVKQAYRSNRYAGTCCKCKNNVPAEAGRIDKTENGWQVSHIGQCPEKITAPKIAIDNERYSGIPRGHYATKSLTGNQDFDFWRVDRPEQGTYAGRTFVKRIVGGKPDMNVSRDTRFAALEAILAEGIDVCGTRYGVELGRCRRCNRHLTDQTSRELGIGPECRSKG